MKNMIKFTSTIVRIAVHLTIIGLIGFGLLALSFGLDKLLN